MAWDDKHKACIIATLATVEAGFNYGIITAPDTLSLGIGQWTQGRAYDLLQQFPDKNVFGPTIRSWLAAGKGTWTMARKYQSLGGTDRQKLSAALASEEGRRYRTTRCAKTWRTSTYPDSKPWAGLGEVRQAGMLLIVVMHRWGNYARISTGWWPAQGRRPHSTPWRTPSKRRGWYAVGQRYVIAYRMIKNLDTKGITLAPGDSGGDNSKDGEDKARRRRRSNTPEQTAPACCASTCRTAVMPLPTPPWEGSGRPTEPTRSPTTGTTRRVATMVGGWWGRHRQDRGDDQTRQSLHRQVRLPPMVRAAAAPDKSGVTDCSGFVWWLYNKVMGMDIGKGGTTVLMSQGGKVIAEGGGRFNATSQIKEETSSSAGGTRGRTRGVLLRDGQGHHHRTAGAPTAYEGPPTDTQPPCSAGAGGS